MNLLTQRKALYRIAEDKLRLWMADHGGSVISGLRPFSKLLPRTRELQFLMLEHRLSLQDRTTSLIKDRLPQIIDALPDLVPPPDPLLSLDGEEFRAIVLRPPTHTKGIFRRGVLLIKFTETFRFFFHRLDIEQLLRCFHVVLEPSWSGYCLPEILLWTRYKDPIIVQASEVRDREFIEALGTNLVPIEVGASDWVDHRIFRPLDVPKIYDVIYVANLTAMKRVNVYLRALSEIKKRRPNVRAAIVLSSWGGNREAFEQMLRHYGVVDHLTVLMNQTQAQLNELINRSRVSVLLSRKEGSNKTLFESMFANTPVILLSNNVGVNKDYINEYTGRLVREAELPDAILEFASGSTLQPRVWAMANITPERSTQKLEAKLASIGADVPGISLFVKVNAPEATYMDARVAARMPQIGTVLRQFEKGVAPSVNIEERVLTLFANAPVAQCADREPCERAAT